jgi:hypothetical protein
VAVKSWLTEQPSVDDARPARCPACGNAARPTGGSLGLHGHGTRRRQLRGLLEPSGESGVHELKVRRFRCTACRATTTVAPATVLTKRLYLASTMALAFVLLGVRHLAHRAVRARLSAWKTLGDGSSSRWDALLDWLNAVRERRLFPAVRAIPKDWPPWRVAERAATTLAALGPPGLSPVEAAAFEGAARAG